MLKPILKHLLIGSLLIIMSACGLESDESDDNRFDKLKKQRDTYEKIQGVYKGRMLRSSSSDVDRPYIPIELKIHVLEGLAGRTENGRIPVVDLSGYFRRLDMIQTTDDLPFEAEFNELTGEFLMIYAPSAGQPGERVSITGTIVGENITNGRYELLSGLVGTFTAEKISSEVNAPDQGDAQERRERAEKYYAPILGLYNGHIYEGDLDVPSFLLSISIDLEDDPIDQELKLKAAVTRPDINYNYGVMDAEYLHESHRISIKGKTISRGIPGSWTASGYLKNGKLILERVSDHRGPIGRFLGHRQ